MHLSDKSFKTIPYLASKHKWDGAVGACYFTVAQHWRKAIQVFDAGRHSVPGHFNPSAIEVPANCFHELCPLPALDVHPHLSARSAEAATWCLHPASPCQLSPLLYLFAWLDSTQSAWQIKALLKKAVLERALEEPCCLPWPGGVAVGGGAGGGLEGSRARGVSCHNARDSPRSISAAALPPTAEELLPWLGGKRSRFGRSPTQLSKQDTPSGARERGEVSRLEGEGRAIALSLLHSSLERNWVFEPKVAVCRPGERDKNDPDHLEVKRGGHIMLSQQIYNHKDNREGKILNQTAASMTSDVQLWNLISKRNTSIKNPKIDSCLSYTRILHVIQCWINNSNQLFSWVKQSSNLWIEKIFFIFSCL